MVELALPFLEANNFDITVSETQFKGHATELANQLPFTDYAGIIVAGGDGTLHEVINGMLARQDGQTLPLGLIPGGSGNSLAVDLGQQLPRRHRLGALPDRLERPRERRYLGAQVRWQLSTQLHRVFLEPVPQTLSQSTCIPVPHDRAQRERRMCGTPSIY